MRAAPENIRIPDQFCALATDPSVMRYANSYSQLFGAPLRVTVASIHTGTVRVASEGGGVLEVPRESGRREVLRRKRLFDRRLSSVVGSRARRYTRT